MMTTHHCSDRCCRKTEQQYELAENQFLRWLAANSLTLTPDDVTAEHIREWISSNPKWSARTRNNKRQKLLTLLNGFRRNPLRMPKYRETPPPPDAWTILEVRTILDQCKHAQPVGGCRWGPEHWIALVLTVLDTSCRIGALLSVRRDALAGDWLTIPGDLHKHRKWTRHRLHPDTVAAIRELPESTLLFDWPIHRREIWRRYRDILKSAGLPHTRRDLFHRLRRTSYTLVYDTLGPESARLHAGHSTDLSHLYYDDRGRARSAALAIPRP